MDRRNRLALEPTYGPFDRKELHGPYGSPDTEYVLRTNNTIFVNDASKKRSFFYMLGYDTKKAYENYILITKILKQSDR